MRDPPPIDLRSSSYYPEAMKELLKNPQVIAGAIVFALFLLFNSSHRPIEGEAERRYEQWLSGVQKTVDKSGSASPSVPAISIEISSTTIPSLNWKVATTQNSEEVARNREVVRLLDLVRAARILSTSGSESDEIHLKVTEGEKSFSAHFNRRDAEKNLQLATMLKLFQVYVMNHAPETLSRNDSGVMSR